MDKIKNIKVRGIALLTAAFTVVGISKMMNEVPENYPSEFEYISQYENNFTEYFETIKTDDEYKIAYTGKNISFAINKNTFEATKYIYEVDDYKGEIYDLQSAKMIVNIDGPVTLWNKSLHNWKKILDENYIVDLVNISDYIEGAELKETYTYLELEEIESLIVEAVKEKVGYIEILPEDLGISIKL